MKRYVIAASVAACVASPVSATSLSDYFTSYFAFGDSLTDDGKFGSLFPPSFEGRFTNGLTYSEMLADGFPEYENYALGGATAGDNENVYSPALQQYETLGKQIDQFEADLPTKTLGSDPLISILMGSNDIFQNFDEAGYDVTATVDFVIDGIRRIAGLGPFRDFVVPLTPGGDSGTFGSFRNAYNAYFLSRVGELTSDNIRVYIPNLDAASARIAAAPWLYGITETGQCSTSLFAFDPNSCAIASIDPVTFLPIIDLTRANAYFLVDDVHPTTPVHTEWAAEITATVKSQLPAVPLPASGLLLVAGLGALALRARKA